jgi:hypothetical protein
VKTTGSERFKNNFIAWQLQMTSETFEVLTMRKSAFAM